MRPTSKEKKFVQRILTWFSENKRTFPWRKTQDPYKILVTEQLLRKTTAKQVNDIYEKFFAVFPSFAELAQSPKGKIKTLIRPLGLQNQRTELLHEISTKLVELGSVPKEEGQLLSLPGVGQYCADALRCLAFGEDVPMVDRNVVRVINRVFSILPRNVNPLSEKAAKTCRSFVREFLPKGKSKSFNLALLDFAASICLATKPKCAICSALSICDYGPLHLRHVHTLYVKSLEINKRRNMT